MLLLRKIDRCNEREDRAKNDRANRTVAARIVEGVGGEGGESPWISVISLTECGYGI